jgi:3-hydroxyacyl-CoA dehydrogenase
MLSNHFDWTGLSNRTAGIVTFGEARGQTMTSAPVRLEIENGLGFLLIDHPPVNAASHAVRAGLLDHLKTALGDGRVRAIVVACDGRTFVSGADIREFGKPAQAPILPDLVNQFEAAAKPIVAAMHGTALGGGLEIALACHARILETNACVALPEVKLGIIPGAGGTQRLPRLVGVLAALDMVTSGRRVGAAEALQMGLVDAVADGDLRQQAAQLAIRLAGIPPRRTGALAIAPFDAPALRAAMAGVAKTARGWVAPIRAAEAVSFAVDHPLVDGLRREREILVELIDSAQAKALRYVFFAEREVQKAAHPPPTSPPVIAQPAVIGAGTMGAGIAVALLSAGLPVEVIERDEGMGAGWDRIAGILNRQLAASRITQAQHRERLERLKMSSSWDGLSSCDLIIEAVFEDLALKREVFSKLGQIAAKEAILATNTSFLDIDEIAQASGRRDKVLGMHFFSPAYVMRLIEVVATEHTQAPIIAAAIALAKKLGKLPVVCRACEGFVGNRILNAYRALAEFMVEDGAMPQEVDAALEAYGFPMGVFAVSDLAGLDIGLARRKYLAARRNPLARYPSAVADRLCELGRFGQKTGAGWYCYRDGKRQLDPLVTQIVLDVAEAKQISRQNIAPDTMQRQLRAVMVNEGAKILSEGIVPRALDIDMIMIHGYGFPAWRGGPMFEADTIGLNAILTDVESVHARAGTGFEPAPLLVQRAARGDRFGTSATAAE